MSGLILPDVPYEEKEEFDVVLKKYGLDLISMIFLVWQKKNSHIRLWQKRHLAPLVSRCTW